MNPSQQTLERLKPLGWWYQHFTLPCGTRTGDGQEPAYDPEPRWKLFEPYIPADLSGKTVLDLGGCAGYFSIQMKLRGAARCVLVEPFLEFAGQARFAAAEFGVDIEVIAEDAHVYCLTTEEQFDYVLFLGLLYHLRHPLLVLDRLAGMTRERMVVASAIIGPEAELAARDRDFDRGDDEFMLSDPGYPRLIFIENRYYGDPTNWWLPNYAALPAMLRSAGMKVIARPHAHVVVAEPEAKHGAAVYGKLVFPRYAKPGGAAVFPGEQRIDPQLWSELCARNQEYIRKEAEKFRRRE